MASKLNNNRRFPNANRQPRHLADLRRETAKTNKEEYDKLTTQQKLEKLDNQFGKGKGAAKQRARLTALLEKESKQPEDNKSSKKDK